MTVKSTSVWQTIRTFEKARSQPSGSQIVRHSQKKSVSLHQSSTASRPITIHKSKSWTEETSSQMDRLAEVDRSHTATRSERNRYENLTIWATAQLDQKELHHVLERTLRRYCRISEQEAGPPPTYPSIAAGAATAATVAVAAKLVVIFLLDSGSFVARLYRRTVDSGSMIDSKNSSDLSYYMNSLAGSMDRLNV